MTPCLFAPPTSRLNKRPGRKGVIGVFVTRIRVREVGKWRRLTPLQGLDLLEGLALGLLALLQLGDLDLLAELLEVAQLAGLGGRLLGGRLLHQLRAHALHVAVVLDHLSEVVRRAGEGERVLLREGTSSLCPV